MPLSSARCRHAHWETEAGDELVLVDRVKVLPYISIDDLDVAITEFLLHLAHGQPG